MDSADSDDDKVRALLARAGEQPGPPLGFTPTTIARRGRRIRLLRWGGGIAGVLVVLAGASLSVLLLANRPAQPASRPPTPPAATTTTTATPTGTTTTTATTTGSPGTTTTSQHVTDTTTTTSLPGDPTPT
jgi:hypothetical protein